MHNLRDKLSEVYDRVHRAEQKAGRAAGSVQIVAVSKKQPATAIREAYACGQRLFGENYLQEAIEKQCDLEDLAIEWHFIGPIQSNKTKTIAAHFDWVHSVDREKIARRLSEQRASTSPPLQICLQVNIDNEDTKSGLPPDQLFKTAKAIQHLPHITLRGLMAIPAPRDNQDAQLAVFHQVSDLFIDLQNHLDAPKWDTLSMGMSGDLEAAVAAGATMVRIGTDIFGARN